MKRDATGGTPKLALGVSRTRESVTLILLPDLPTGSGWPLYGAPSPLTVGKSAPGRREMSVVSTPFGRRFVVGSRTKTSGSGGGRREHASSAWNARARFFRQEPQRGDTCQPGNARSNHRTSEAQPEGCDMMTHGKRPIPINRRGGDLICNALSRLVTATAQPASATVIVRYYCAHDSCNTGHNRQTAAPRRNVPCK